MTKAATSRQIETAKRELDKAISDVIGAWRKHNPYPTWEEEQEWEQANPSPRRQHREVEDDLRSVLEAQANDLMVQIKMGEVSSDEAYQALKHQLEKFNERKLSYLRLGSNDTPAL